MTQAPPEVRTYGGWRRSRGMGLFGLGPAATVVTLGGVLAVLVAASFGLRAALITAAPATIIVGAAVAHIDGVPLSHIVVARVRWLHATMRGHTRWRGGIIVEHPRAWQLPGVLAPTALVTAEDGTGGSYGLVWDRRGGTLTATLRCAALSTWLANPNDADAWVANWGAWLASLGHQPAIRWVTVTVDTAPDPGSTLHDHVRSRLASHAPAPARDLMEELVRHSPAAAADVDTRVSITFDPATSPSKPKDLPAAAAEFSRILHGLTSALGACGVSVVGRATAAELAGMVRTAFDPAARGDVARVLNSADPHNLLTWADAGPVAADESFDHYRHDSGISVSWAMHEAPRQAVNSNVLARLLSPGLHPKRVTLQYRPYSAGAAARLLESEVNAAAFRAEVARRQGRDATARDLADQHRARQAATEEAMGAGVCLISMYATVTVEHDDDLPTAIADVEARAETAKIRLRRMYFSQAAGFAVTLPAGICLPVLSRRWPR
ncbi:SCO6880 family protein [Salinispora arenicola]|uniref:SCO6880 family protein n=1 Tax=Salinispora arenicola TaxID=168697 RepID=UPI0003A70A31|nr:SCO6880 family protein [Salinispora arenicola]